MSLHVVSSRVASPHGTAWHGVSPGAVLGSSGLDVFDLEATPGVLGGWNGFIKQQKRHITGNKSSMQSSKKSLVLDVAALCMGTSPSGRTGEYSS